MEKTATATITFGEFARNLSMWLAAIPATLYGVSTVSIGLLTLFMVIDTLTGIAKSWKISGGQSITSARLASGVAGKLLFLLVPCVIALTGHAMNPPLDLSMLVKWAVNIMVLSEAYSIISNIYSYHTGQTVKEFDAVSYITKALLNFLEKAIGERQEPKA